MLLATSECPRIIPHGDDLSTDNFDPEVFDTYLSLMGEAETSALFPGGPLLSGIILRVPDGLPGLIIDGADCAYLLCMPVAGGGFEDADLPTGCDYVVIMLMGGRRDFDFDTARAGFQPLMGDEAA